MSEIEKLTKEQADVVMLGIEAVTGIMITHMLLPDLKYYKEKATDKEKEEAEKKMSRIHGFGKKIGIAGITKVECKFYYRTVDKPEFNQKKGDYVFYIRAFMADQCAATKEEEHFFEKEIFCKVQGIRGHNIFDCPIHELYEKIRSYYYSLIYGIVYDAELKEIDDD